MPGWRALANAGNVAASLCGAPPITRSGLARGLSPEAGCFSNKSENKTSAMTVTAVIIVRKKIARFPGSTLVEKGVSFNHC